MGLVITPVRPLSTPPHSAHPGQLVGTQDEKEKRVRERKWVTLRANPEAGWSERRRSRKASPGGVGRTMEKEPL